jgi:8-oxo-dGTP diphosphatase
MLTADVVALAGAGPDAVLLVQRENPPFPGRWALPGGFVDERERTRAAAGRELNEETGLACGRLELVGVYDAPDRDPRGWVVSVAYLAVLEREEAVTGGDDAGDARWFALDALPSLAFDHAEVIADAVGRARAATPPPA